MLDKIPVLNRIDPFILMLIAVVVAASLLPVRGAGAVFAGGLTDAAIVLLFFLHGAKLSREAILSGFGAWRVHGTVLTATYVLFPLIGIAVRYLFAGWTSPALLDGLLFLCLLPSTVQSSVAFTAIARGNVAAAVCSASISNIAGIFLTPLLASLLIGHMATGSGDAIQKIAFQLLLPFIAGHLCRPLLLGFLDRHKALIGRVDRGSILLVVYTAFSASVVEGMWHRLDAADLVLILAIDLAILAIVLLATWTAGRRLGFSRADEIVILFCGSKKSLVSGVPIAGTLFPAAMMGPVILPLMLFPQIQLMACAVIAQRYRSRTDG